MDGSFAAADPNYATRIADSLANQSALQTVGARLERVEPGRCLLRLPFADHILQQDGFVHGGIVGMIADSSAGYAAISLLPAEETVLTAEYKIHLLAPAIGDYLLASGSVLRAGRSLVIVESEVTAVREGKDSRIAKFIGTMARVRHPRAE